jgi:hypothetical protein
VWPTANKRFGSKNRQREPTGLYEQHEAMSRFAKPLPWQVEDGEPYLGWREKIGFGLVGCQNFDDRENEDEREPNGGDDDDRDN